MPKPWEAYQNAEAGAPKPWEAYQTADPKPWEAYQNATAQADSNQPTMSAAKSPTLLQRGMRLAERLDKSIPEFFLGAYSPPISEMLFKHGLPTVAEERVIPAIRRHIAPEHPKTAAALESLTEATAGFGTPAAALTMGGLGALGAAASTGNRVARVARPLAEIGFGTSIGIDAAQKTNAAADAFINGKDEDAVRLLTHAGVSTLMAGGIIGGLRLRYKTAADAVKARNAVIEEMRAAQAKNVTPGAASPLSELSQNLTRQPGAASPEVPPAPPSTPPAIRPLPPEPPAGGIPSVLQPQMPPSPFSLKAALATPQKSLFETIQSEQRLTPAAQPATVQNAGGGKSLTKQIAAEKKAQFADEIRKLAEIAESGGGSDKFIRYAPVDELTQSEAKENIGLDLSGYSRIADAYGSQHLYKEHTNTAKELSRGNVPLSKEDIGSVPEVVTTPDVRIYGTKNRRNQNSIISMKTMPDGSLLVIEEVRTGRKALALYSMWKYPAERGADSIIRTLVSNARSDGGDIKIIHRNQSGNQQPAKGKTLLEQVQGGQSAPRTTHDEDISNPSFSRYIKYERTDGGISLIDLDNPQPWFDEGNDRIRKLVAKRDALPATAHAEREAYYDEWNAIKDTQRQVYKLLSYKHAMEKIPYMREHPNEITDEYIRDVISFGHSKDAIAKALGIDIEHVNLAEHTGIGKLLDIIMKTYGVDHATARRLIQEAASERAAIQSANSN